MRGCAAVGRRFVTRISASGRPGPGPRSTTRRARSRRASTRWGSPKATGSPIVGANRPRLYWTITAAQMLGAVPVPVYADSVADEIAAVLDHAGRQFHRRAGSGTGRQDASPIAARLPRSDASSSTTRSAALRDYGDPRLRSLDAVMADGPRGARRRWRRRGARRAHQRRRRRRSLGDPLHLGHDGAIQGRRAERRALHRGGARHRRLRQSDRSRRSARLSAARLGRRSLSQLRARLRRRILHGLPGKRRHRRRGPARNRADVPFRAAARVRGAADAGDDPHGGRERAQALAVPSFHGRRAPLGREASSTGEPRALAARGCTMRSAKR